MEAKGHSAELSYPNIFFTIDSFDEVSIMYLFIVALFQHESITAIQKLPFEITEDVNGKENVCYYSMQSKIHSIKTLNSLLLRSVMQSLS